MKCIDAVKSAIQVVSTIRSRFGAIQNRLDHTINNLDNVVENTRQPRAQSNQANQGVLSLLG